MVVGVLVLIGTTGRGKTFILPAQEPAEEARVEEEGEEAVAVNRAVEGVSLPPVAVLPHPLSSQLQRPSDRPQMLRSHLHRPTEATRSTKRPSHTATPD